MFNTAKYLMEQLSALFGLLCLKLAEQLSAAFKNWYRKAEMLKLLWLSRGCRQILVSITKIQHSHLKEIKHCKGSQVLPVGDRSKRDLKKQCVFVTSFPSLIPNLCESNRVQNASAGLSSGPVWAGTYLPAHTRFATRDTFAGEGGRQSLRLIFNGFVDLLTRALKLWRRVMSPLHLSWAWKQVVFHYIRFLDK